MKVFNLNSLVRENIKSLKPYASARDEFKGVVDDMVFLDANENPFETGLNRYPDPLQSKVKTSLSELKEIQPNQILLGNGSDEVLDLIFRAFCEPNVDNIIILPPTYGMYKVLANINAVEIQEVKLSADFQPQVERILEIENQQSKVLFFCSPNNPTANSFEAKHIKILLEEFKGIVVVDEAYTDFSSSESWLSQLEYYPNLIVTQTLSKAYGMAGIRLGIAYASEAIISVLNKIKPPYNVNELTQLQALERLEDRAGVQQEVKTILEERTLLIKALKSCKFIEKIYPTDANFILVKVDDATKRYNQLITQGIVVRNRTHEPLCDNCLRLTVGTSEENNKLIAKFKQLENA